MSASSLAYHRSVASSSSDLVLLSPRKQTKALTNPIEQSEMNVDPEYTPDFGRGMRSEVQHLYRSDDRAAWNESIPEKPVVDAEAGSYAQEFALIVRREPHPITHQVALHSITIQSPRIKKVLERIFQGFEGLNTQLKDLTFKAPFHPFYYRWHLLEKLREEELDPEVQDHLSLLYPILCEEIMPQIEVMRDLTKNNVMSFDCLWTVLAPGTEIYTQVDGQPRLMELTDSRYGANMSGEFFTLECRYIDCDGSSFGYVSTSLDIDKFDGVRRLIELVAFPCHLHPDVDTLVDRLHARGERFEQLNGFHHMSYSGFYKARSSRQIRKRHVESSRIIIDPHTFDIYGTPGPGLGSINAAADPGRDATDEEPLAVVPNVMLRATSHAYRVYQSAVERHNKRAKDSLSDRTLSPKQRLLCNHVVRGYCLSFKTWAEFYVENIGPIRWSDDAFPRLVLPHGYKEIIRAFVQEQLARDDEFDDIVYGKGLGFIMLLAGEPGVGKTLTAESVAEEMRQPLYLMSASELGETATEVEESLEQVLQLTSKWNAILLLDECDMFLEARSTADLRRNRLVSVFLRQLEYYRGVMFLTSNRVSDFDPAFESRIHLTIHYPSLGPASRLHIWRTFTEMGAVESRLSEENLEALAAMDMNGRQIKNTVKTARLLSKQERVPLGMEHIEMVLRVGGILADESVNNQGLKK
ncbi:P-loop containing nucleoside triphosphate hydrolase protein [Aspergillus steynii IBT 23096]|uniref:P-loop containing nucleoside triphosphate hydrolase protein n=1 Tax=Aspergillus steynii IBT 23096 TaxID=1392250 RepID=A0A2I2GB28_9EURO|nr:P-loop containing nucleoside triphosphate hydrolase protein [Aspergillus steynii IBT 23096]PLB50093.1 P-loop containing nucleoside triphosphate hydrolase protein [Aspergillus steynii IBT 23096]